MCTPKVFPLLKAALIIAGFVQLSLAASQDSANTAIPNLGIFVSLGPDFPRGSTSMNTELGAYANSNDYNYNLGKGLDLSIGADIKLVSRLGLHTFAESRWVVPRMSVNSAAVGPAANTDTYHTYTFGFGATLRPYFSVFDFMNCYVGVGAGLYFSSIHIKGSNAANNSVDGRIHVDPSVALLGEMGASLPITAAISVFADCEFADMTFKVKSYHSTTNNSADINYTNNDNLHHPYRISGSTLGLHVGISYNIK